MDLIGSLALLLVGGFAFGASVALGAFSVRWVLSRSAAMRSPKQRHPDKQEIRNCLARIERILNGPR